MRNEDSFPKHKLNRAKAVSTKTLLPYLSTWSQKRSTQNQRQSQS